MSKRKYQFKVTDIEALLAEYSQAVEKKEIPARVELKPVYSIIAKLLDCQIAVPGIELLDTPGDEEGHPADDEGKPAYLRDVKSA